MDYTLAVHTDIGTQKPGNQDSLCVRRAVSPEGGEILLAAVCDGMGGLSKGEEASARLITALEHWFDSHLELIAQARDFTEARRQLTDLIAAQNRQIAEYAQAAGVQMGSTLTALLAVGRRCLTVNVGDSRIYLIKDGRAIQLTADQSLVEREIRQGRITREEAKHHPQRNVLLQCVGIGREVTPVFGENTVENGGVYVICSDGFCHELTDEELAGALLYQAMGTADDMRRALVELTERCKARGEGDNITAVAVKAAESAVPVSSGGLFRRILGRKKDPPPLTPPAYTALEAFHILHTEGEG